MFAFQLQFSQHKKLLLSAEAQRYLTEEEKSRRLLYLFQLDLLPGLQGEILDAKQRRDDKYLAKRSQLVKVLGWLYILALDVGMLFYVFLFAVQQDASHQRAWAKSFGIWLIMAIGLVSTMVVLLMHVLIPSLIMQDIRKIKLKLRENVASYYEKTMANEAREREGELAMVDAASDHEFNAAKYLFVSYRL